MLAWQLQQRLVRATAHLLRPLGYHAMPPLTPPPHARPPAPPPGVQVAVKVINVESDDAVFGAFVKEVELSAAFRWEAHGMRRVASGPAGWVGDWGWGGACVCVGGGGGRG